MATDNPITHWTPQRKAAFIRAIRAGELVREAVLVEHWSSPEEYASWERDYDSAGTPGLRSTRYQIYRGRSPGQRPRGRPRGKALAMMAIAGAIMAGPVRAETMVPQFEGGTFACPDLGYYKKSMDQLTEPGFDARRQTEQDYTHGCYDIPMGLGGEIIARNGPYMLFRPCTWSTAFWTDERRDEPEVRLPGDRCAP